MREFYNHKRIPEETNFTEEVGSDLLVKQLNKYMQSGIFTLSWGNVRSALCSAIVTAVLGGAGYILGIGDVFKLDVHTLVNIGALAGLTAIVSLLKNFLTSNQGNFVGVVNTTS